MVKNKIRMTLLEGGGIEVECESDEENLSDLEKRAFKDMKRLARMTRTEDEQMAYDKDKPGHGMIYR